MPDSTTHVFGAHLLLEEERKRFRNTVDQLEKQRAEAQEEVDELINALRRERDLGDEEIIFLKAQLRGIQATKYENEDKVETLDKENEALKEELKKETYKRKKLKERFLELQDLVNDESVVLVKEVEKRDEEIEALKEDIAELKDEIAAAEADRDKAQDKEERLLEECEKLNNAVEDLQDQLKASERDIIAYKTILEEKGVNTDDRMDEPTIQLKADLEEEKRKVEELENQLEEVKTALEDSEKELIEDIEAKEKRIQQLKRALEDNEYVNQAKNDNLYLDNEKLKEDIENLKEQLQDQLNNPSQDLPEFGVSQEKYDQLLQEMEKEKEERLKLQNHFKDLKSYVDKDTADLIAEVQERDAVIESMNDKLDDLDNLDKLEAELDYERKQRKIDEAKIRELRAAISQDKKDIVADSEKKSDMIRQLKGTLTDAKTNLERARYKQREIIANNQRLRADNQALQKELDDLKASGVGRPGSPTDRKKEELLQELKASNRDLQKERELRGQLAGAMQELKNTLSDDEADLVDEIHRRDVIIANLHVQLREETDRLQQQVNNHRRREEEVLDDYQAVKEKIENVERDCEPLGHQPAIKDLERDMFEDLSEWLTEEVRILDTALGDRAAQLSELEDLLRERPQFDEERVHYVKELAAQENELSELRQLNRRMEREQADKAREYEKQLEALNKDNLALRRRLGSNITSDPIHDSADSLPIAVMSQSECPTMEESGLGLSVAMDSFDLQRATPPGQAAPSPHHASEVALPEKYDDSKERELIGQLRQIYSNLDMCRQDINRIVESFHDRIVRHHPRLQRRDSPTRLNATNIGSTINTLLEGYHSQVTDLINRLNTDSSTIARRNESLEDVVQQLENNLAQERTRYDQLHARCKSYRQEIQDLRGRLRDGAAHSGDVATHMEGDHANHDLCQAVHELLNDMDSGPSTAEGRPRAPSIQEISRLLLPVAEQGHVPNELSATPDGVAFKEDCDVIQEKTDELSELVKGLHSRLDAQKQAKIDALQEKVKEYEQEMDRLRDLIGEEAEKENEIEALRERNRQLALNLRDSQADLEGSERKNAILGDKLGEANDALSNSVEELGELRRKTREREAYIRQLQENLRRADDKLQEKDASNENLRNNCDELQEKAQQLSSLIKEVESKFVEKSRQYTLLEKEFNKLKDNQAILQDYCDKKNAELDRKSQKIDELEMDLRDLINENQKLVNENAELTDETQVKDEKIKELENRLDAKEKLIAELEKISSKMAGDIDERDKVLQDMNSEVEKLEKEADDKEELIKQLEEDLEKQDQELEKQDTELEEKKADIDKLEDEVKDRDREIEELKNALADLEKDLAEAKDDEEKLKEDIAELERDLDDKQKELDDAKSDIEALKDQLGNAKAEADDAAAEQAKLEDYIKDLEDTLKEEKAENEDLEAENDKLEKENDKLKDTVADQKDDMDKLADIVSELERDIAEGDKENEDLRDDIDELKKNIDDLAKQKQEILDQVQDALQDMDKEREDYKTNLADLMDSLKDQSKDMDLLKSQVVEKPELEHRCMQTDVEECRSVRQQTDEVEMMNVRIQTVIEEAKTPKINRRIQTDEDPIMAAKATAKTQIKKSSSLHILRAMMNTVDRPTQTLSYS